MLAIEDSLAYNWFIGWGHTKPRLVATGNPLILF